MPESWWMCSSQLLRGWSGLRFHEWWGGRPSDASTWQHRAWLAGTVSDRRRAMWENTERRRFAVRSVMERRPVCRAISSFLMKSNHQIPRICKVNCCNYLLLHSMKRWQFVKHNHSENLQLYDKFQYCIDSRCLESLHHSYVSNHVIPFVKQVHPAQQTEALWFSLKQNNQIYYTSISSLNPNNSKIPTPIIQTIPYHLVRHNFCIHLAARQYYIYPIFYRYML